MPTLPEWPDWLHVPSRCALQARGQSSQSGSFSFRAMQGHPGLNQPTLDVCGCRRRVHWWRLQGLEAAGLGWRVLCLWLCLLEPWVLGMGTMVRSGKNTRTQAAGRAGVCVVSSGTTWSLGLPVLGS